MTTALLVIDVQCGMFEFGQTPYDGDAVVARLAGLIARAREQGVSVIYVQHDGGAGDEFEHGTPGWEIHPAVAPNPGEPVVEKTRCSGFYRTNLDALLRDKGIDRLIVGGMQSEYCVDTTCRAAYDLGYQVVLVEDGHTTYDSPAVRADQIIAHHNLTLMGSFVDLVEADAATF